VTEPPARTFLVYTTGVDKLHTELTAKDGLGRQRPGLERDDLGTWLEVIDPFGNVLRFLE
jgi:Glyoxalase superfamily protein